MTAPSPLFAEWFSGTITITEGKQLKSSHFGFPRYEWERIIEIVNGIVQNIEIINNTERAKKEGWRTLKDYIEEDSEDAL